MAIQIKHPFTSAKGDGGDATLVRPSNWNALHTTSMASGNLLGRLTVGAGVFEEIPISALVAAALDETDGAAFLAALGIGGFTTGDVKYSFSTTPAAGWVVVNTLTGSIGNAGSAATVRAHADTLNLYTLLWNGVSNTYAPVSGGRGASAAADFAALKTLQIPTVVGRAPRGSGTGGSGITSRDVGLTGGTETHTLTTAEMPSHYHSASIYDPGHGHAHNLAALTGSSTGGGAFACCGYVGGTINAATTNVRVNSSNGLDTTNSTGSGGAHNNISPFIVLATHVKL